MIINCPKCLVEKKTLTLDDNKVSFEGVYRFATLHFDEGDEPEFNEDMTASDIDFNDDSQLGEYAIEEWKIVTCSDDLKDEVEEILEDGFDVEGALEELGFEYEDGCFELASLGPFKAEFVG